MPDHTEQQQKSSSLSDSTWTAMATQEAAAQQQLQRLRGEGAGGVLCRLESSLSSSSRHSSRASTPQQPPLVRGWLVFEGVELMTHERR